MRLSYIWDSQCALTKPRANMIVSAMAVSRTCLLHCSLWSSPTQSWQHMSCEARCLTKYGFSTTFWMRYGPMPNLLCLIAYVRCSGSNAMQNHVAMGYAMLAQMVALPLSEQSCACNTCSTGSIGLSEQIRSNWPPLTTPICKFIPKPGCSTVVTSLFTGWQVRV